MSKLNMLKSDLPDGRYCLICWDIDTTGRRLVDNICQLAAYSSNSIFSEYIMPFKNFNPYAERYHDLCVITTKRCRVLKDLKTNKLVKTKSEISVLVNFINWLEANRGDATDGVILVCHESRKVAPTLLLEALQHYNLMERFAAVIKGFVNSYDVAKHQYEKTMNSVSLKVFSKLLLNKDEYLGNAVKRTALCYQVVHHVAQKVTKTNNQDQQTQAVNIFKNYASSIDAEEKELARFKKLLARQNTFRPVFEHFLKINRKNRQYASNLRKKLVDNDLEYEKLKSAFEEGGRKSIEEILKEISSLSKKQHEELLEILDCHFDPAKESVKPKVWPKQNKKQDNNDKLNVSTENVTTLKNENK